MEDKNEIKDETTEKTESLGQQILGELEIIGGILTGDPVTRSEGEFNVGAGATHHQASEDLHPSDEEQLDWWLKLFRGLMSSKAKPWGLRKAIFHFREIQIPVLKNYLRSQKITVR